MKAENSSILGTYTMHFAVSNVVCIGFGKISN